MTAKAKKRESVKRPAGNKSPGAADPTQDPAAKITIDELAEQAAELEEPEISEPARDIIKKRKPYNVKLTAAGEPLPINPDTGEIDTEKLTDAQRAELTAASKKMIDAAKQFFDKSISEKLRAATLPTREAMRAITDVFQPVNELIKEIDELEPYIKEELQKPEYEVKTITELLNLYELWELPELPDDSLLNKVLQAARDARNTALLIDPYRADKMLLPTDKVNLFAWDLKETNGQIKFDLARAGTSDSAAALFSLSFDDDPNIKITKEINHFDKRVMSVVGTAFNSGCYFISATGIYYAMGGTGKPSTDMIERINTSLTKLDMAKIFIDNEMESNIYNYDHFRKEDRLLHIKRITAKSNGKIADSFIQILEEPIFMTFARQRKQISAVPIKVLQSPVRKTNNNMRIDDYLQWRIVQQKNVIDGIKKQKYTQDKQKLLREASKLIITLKTFYERTHNSKKDSTGKKRARETAKKYLEHYKSDNADNWITDYKMDNDRIIITLPIK